MKKSFSLFNTICIFLIVGALFGALWLFRGTFRTWWYQKKSSDIPLSIPRSEIQKQRETSPRSLLPQVNTVLPKDVTSTQPMLSKTVQKQATSSISQSSEIVSSSSSFVLKAIPPEINLALPFVPQAPEKNWKEPWQDACEEAAILMMQAYYQDKIFTLEEKKQNIIDIIAYEEKLGWGYSIEIEKIQQIFTDYFGFDQRAQIIENPSIEQIKNFIASGQPVLVVADGKVLPNPHFQNGGPVYHALVIRGYTKDSFISNDPGTQFGENFKYKYNDLMNAIRDWNGGDVKNGRRVMLVIE